jgi:carbohydrate-selective porin OprB
MTTTVKGAGYAWEFFYKFQVTDNITVTPAIHYLSKPFAAPGFRWHSTP